MTKPMKKSNVRMTFDEYRRVAEQARALGMSVNRYITAASLAYATDTDQATRIEAIVERQTDALVTAVAGALTNVVQAANDAADDRDRRWRQCMRAALARARSTFDEPTNEAQETGGYGERDIWL